MCIVPYHSEKLQRLEEGLKFILEMKETKATWVA